MACHRNPALHLDLDDMQQHFCLEMLRHQEYAIDVKHALGHIKYPGPYWILG